MRHTYLQPSAGSRPASMLTFITKDQLLIAALEEWKEKVNWCRRCGVEVLASIEKLLLSSNGFIDVQ
jgi:hypothetical protein